jgi:hypothetical protein
MINRIEYELVKLGFFYVLEDAVHNSFESG